MSRRTRQRRNRSESRQSRARCGSETSGGGQQAARQLLRSERRSVQIFCASEARLKQRRLKNTSVHDHDSDLGSSLGEKRSFQCTRLPSYRRACKKGSPKAWPRQRADECVHGSRPQYRQYSVVCETDTCTQGKEKRQSSRVRVLTGHQKRHKVTICDGVHTNT